MGGTESVRTLNGKTKIEIAPGSIDGTKYRLKKQGLNQLPPNESQKGDHVITLKIAIPDKLTDEQRTKLQAYATIENKPENV